MELYFQCIKDPRDMLLYNKESIPDVGNRTDTPITEREGENYAKKL